MSILDWGGIAVVGVVLVTAGVLLLDRYVKRIKALDDQPDRPGDDGQWGRFRAQLRDDIEGDS